MSRKMISTIVVLVCFVVLFATYATVGGAASSNPAHRVKLLPDVKSVLNSRTGEDEKGTATFCTLSKTNSTPGFYWDMYALGSRTVTYFDPSTCGSPTYPFELSSISFPLNDPGGYQWPVQLDIVVFSEAIAGDPCSGPGDELCRFTITCLESDFSYPTFGTTTFPSPCCVDGPFFIGVEYTDAGSGPFPSVLFDDEAAPTSCDNWQYEGSWTEWYSFWTPPTPGYPIMEVDGETESTNCAADGGIAINEVRKPGARRDVAPGLYISG